MNDTAKVLVAGVVAIGLLGGSVYLGTKKRTEQASACPTAPVLPVIPPPPPVDPIPPTPPVKPEEKKFSASFIRGYHDGYSGVWVAPARWVVISEYRAGWNAGHQDRVAAKPNKFIK